MSSTPNQKAAAYVAMSKAYAQASDNGKLPAPARQVAYAVRRITGLGNALAMDYLLKRGGSNRPGLIDCYMDDHPDETEDWDVIRDARGNLVEPHTYRRVPLGTLEVRRYISRAYLGPDDDDDHVPQFRMTLPTHGPEARFGSILYIEKEGFQEQVSAANVQERWDLAVMSSKGYSVRAARRVLIDLALTWDVTVLVAHDFDQQGIGIFHLIEREVEAIDLGLRLEDVGGLTSEPVSYRSDPRQNLRQRGASEDEIDFLRGDGKTGQRVELNALVGREFIDWLEGKLADAGVTKVTPDQDRLEAAYRRAYKRHLLNARIAEASEEASAEAKALSVPDDLVTRVTAGLDRRPERSWDEVLAELVDQEED
jgi:hypothetical protein